MIYIFSLGAGKACPMSSTILTPGDEFDRMEQGMRQKVAVLDFGGQYAHLIVRRCRELGVYSELFPHDISAESLVEGGTQAIIFSGGPKSVYERDAPMCDLEVFKLGVPILGICYGAQLIAHLKGGVVRRAEQREFGRTEFFVDREDELFHGIRKKLTVWMSHSDRIESLPNAEVLGHTEHSPLAAFRLADRIYGVQFHPEVHHTESGKEIIGNFLFRVCGLQRNWELKGFVRRAIEEVKREVGDGKVICALSGGIDSTTTALLVHKAVGENLTCIYVDHGLMRKNETEELLETFKKLKLRVVHVDARERFMRRLRGVSDPEEKRWIIGEEFIRVFEEEARKLGKVDFLAQGTIYPDRIESARAQSGRRASRIKSHHNVAALPKKMNLKLVEPIKDLYKDEVKEIAKELGLPEEIIKRHPFPGPGLAARIIGEVTEEKLRICREASFIVEEELRRSGWYDKVWQAFAIVGDDLATGVLGDERVLGHVVIVRVVESVEAMTADFARLPYGVLENISRRITNEVKGVTWVAYAISSKPPSTIEPC
ncbi:MAG: GMP synthase [Candidatus Alkanophagales archaeon MCA70_species_2]|nr:GMP synthase [Candidatus Alkanophaga liquidiphilum]